MFRVWPGRTQAVPERTQYELMLLVFWELEEHEGSPPWAGYLSHKCHHCACYLYPSKGVQKDVSALLGCQFYTSMLCCFFVSPWAHQPGWPRNAPTTTRTAEAVMWGFKRNKARIQDERRSNSSASICNCKEQKVWLLTRMHVVWTLFFSWLLLGRSAPD